MRRLFPAFGCALLLAGCVTAPVSRAPLAASAQEALLRDLSDFGFDGRTAVQAGEEGFNASLAWRQRARESQLKLSGPFGAGSMTVVYGPQSLRVSNSHGEQLADADAERALSAQLGFVPPLGALRYWVLGLAAPGEAPTQQVNDAAGRIADLTQQGWRIHYDRWAEVATSSGMVRLPQRLTAIRANLRLRLFVDRWKFQASD